LPLRGVVILSCINAATFIKQLLISNLLPLLSFTAVKHAQSTLALCGGAVGGKSPPAATQACLHQSSLLMLTVRTVRDC
jgi:hypothetical protein